MLALPRAPPSNEDGLAATGFKDSTDPDRLVPIVTEPDDILIAVTGDPGRTNANVFSHNGSLGYPTAKEIHLPTRWYDKLAVARGG